MDERHNETVAAIRAVALPDVLLTEDVARVLRIGVSAARAILRKGIIPAKKIGRRWLVSRSELLRAISFGGASWRFLPSGGRP